MPDRRSPILITPTMTAPTWDAIREAPYNSDMQRWEVPGGECYLFVDAFESINNWALHTVPYAQDQDPGPSPYPMPAEHWARIAGGTLNPRTGVISKDGGRFKVIALTNFIEAGDKIVEEHWALVEQL